MVQAGRKRHQIVDVTAEQTIERVAENRRRRLVGEQDGAVGGDQQCRFR